VLVTDPARYETISCQPRSIGVRRVFCCVRPESNAHVCSEEMFYQLALMQFGSYRRLKLDPPPPLRTLIKLAVDAEPGTEKSGLSKNEIVDVSIPCYLENRSEFMLDHP
jgi:hypothetical protein